MQKKPIVLKSYIPEINSLICLKIYYGNIFSEKLVNELHDWIDKHPHLIQSSNVSGSLWVKTNGTLVKK